MTTDMVKISIIIVSYNVKNFLEHCLESVHRALINIPSEIIVLDNNSADNSVQMLKKRFPDIQLIESKKNLGFSGGNNVAIKKATGEYLVLLNPDTVVQEDTFKTLLSFFNRTPDASAATCKILNPDGTFSIDCRHSIPTPSIALWKVLGLGKLFPRSKVFGRYNLTYLDENDMYPVEAISGSFMMIKREMVEKIGLFDETFFMYCEDIDYCHRINQAKGKIYYVPDTRILHYKGESSKNKDFSYIKTFNEALYHFYKKHHHERFVYSFKWLILAGILLRGFVILLQSFSKRYFSFFIDLISLNLALFLSFFAHFQFNLMLNDIILIHVLSSVVFILAHIFTKNSKQVGYPVQNIIKENVITFTVIILLSLLFNSLEIFRETLFKAVILSLSLMITGRLILRYLTRQTTNILDKQFFQKRTLIAGINEKTSQFLIRLKNKKDIGLKIVGLISTDTGEIGTVIEGIPVVESVQQIKKYLKFNRINTLIFQTQSLSFKHILDIMSDLSEMNIEFKMVPGQMNVIIAKANILILNE